MVVHIEASDETWSHMEPLLDIFVRGDDIAPVFGPREHLLALPPGHPTLNEACTYQSKRCVGMAYNAATTLYVCAEVMPFDLEVKVKMAP